MKLTLELDPLNEKEVGEAHAILTILGGGQTVTGTPTPVNVSNITQSPEDRKDPAAEKAAADKAAADAKAKADADAKAKADKAAADKKAADAKAKAEADAKAATEAEAVKAAEAETTATVEETTEESDDFLDGPTHTIEDVRAALKAYASKHTKEKAVQILKDNGASTIGDLAVDKYPLVMAAASVED